MENTGKQPNYDLCIAFSSISFLTFPVRIWYLCDWIQRTFRNSKNMFHPLRNRYWSSVFIGCAPCFIAAARFIVIAVILLLAAIFLLFRSVPDVVRRLGKGLCFYTWKTKPIFLWSNINFFISPRRTVCKKYLDDLPILSTWVVTLTRTELW